MNIDWSDKELVGTRELNTKQIRNQDRINLLSLKRQPFWVAFLLVLKG